MSQEIGECINSLTVDFLVQCESFVICWSKSRFVAALVALIHRILLYVGAAEHFRPTPLDTCRALVAIGLTLLLYFAFFGYRHLRSRRYLVKELKVAKEELNYLQEKLRQPTQFNDEKQKEIRIFMDGAFDLMHFGHMNAFRLAKSLGTHLVVGVNSDESITKCKGAPLMNDKERLTMVEACKFVDQVVPDCPYIMSKEYLDYVIKEYNIDFVVHGDDPCIVDGKDVYATAKAAGKFQTIPRTEGVSTTDIVGRMLLLTKEHHVHAQTGILGSQSKFLTTSRLLQLFSANVRSYTRDMRVVYIDGAWDHFHPGHVAILKAAKQRGDYLLVGIHGDRVVNKRRGMNLPLLNLHERVLSVLGCRFVDDVLIDAPYEITREMIASLNIAEVIHGTISDDTEFTDNEDLRYKHAKAAKIFHAIKSPSEFRLQNIVKRIHRNEETFQARFERKMKAETQHYRDKYTASTTTGSTTTGRN